MDKKYDQSNLFIKAQKQDKWYKKDEEKSKPQSDQTFAERIKLRRQKADNGDLSDMPPSEGDETVQGKGQKLKNEIKQILYLLYQHNKITKKTTTI